MKKVLYISITRFPPHEDKIWEGLLNAVTSQLKLSDAVVIDMRGNGGGDDTIGMELAKIMFGHEFEYPVQRQYISQTPETFAPIRELGNGLSRSQASQSQSLF
jgi:C-terminal processing protease CtpA/Prc